MFPLQAENLSAPHTRVKSNGDDRTDVISPYRFESISPLSKAIEKIFARQARSRLTLAGVLGLPPVFLVTSATLRDCLEHTLHPGLPDLSG